MTIVVSDTGPLIHLAEIDSLSLLSAFEVVLLPEIVISEFEAGEVPDDFRSMPFEAVSAESNAFDDRGLDPGETAALEIAREYDAVLLTDDLEAREVAVEHEIDVHGSISDRVRIQSRKTGPRRSGDTHANPTTGNEPVRNPGSRRTWNSAAFRRITSENLSTRGLAGVQTT